MKRPVQEYVCALERVACIVKEIRQGNRTRKLWGDREWTDEDVADALDEVERKKGEMKA